MSGETWLQLWPSCTILILLMTSLNFPFGGLRRWLNQGAYVATLNNAQGEFFAAVRGDDQVSEWVEHERLAAAHLTRVERLRNWAGSMVECPWCFGGWASLVSVLVFAEGTLWDRVVWWGPLWLASAAAVVTVNAIGDA